MDLVIGSSGFIGSHVVAALRKRGILVRGYDLAEPTGEAAVPDEMIVGDILEKNSLSEAMKGCRHVYHIAGNPQLWARDPSDFERVNVTGTEMVLDAFTESEAGRRLIFTGTEAILSSPGRAEPIREDVEPKLENAIGAYCRSKFKAEQVVLRGAEYGLDALVVSPTMPLGPGDRNLTPPGKLIERFLQGKIPGYVDAFLNVVDVRDVAEGHVLAAEKGISGQRYLLAGHNISVKELFEKLSEISGVPPPRMKVPYPVALGFAFLEEGFCKIFGGTPVSSVTGVKLCRRNLQFDASRSWETLGHVPRGLDETLRDAVESPTIDSRSVCL